MMEEKVRQGSAEQGSERRVSPYSIRSVRRALGRRRLGEILLLLAFLLFFYGPLAHAFMLAFADTYAAGDIIPSKFGFQWWDYVLGQPNTFRSIINSFLFAFASTALSIMICLPAAYVLARFKFKGRRIIMFSFLIGNAFPKIGMYTSIGIIYYKIGLMGTFFGVLLIHLLGTMMQMIWLPAGSFRSVPRHQEEAARDAGAGPLRTFFAVTLPIAWPGIMVAALRVHRFARRECRHPACRSAAVAHHDDGDVRCDSGLPGDCGRGIRADHCDSKYAAAVHHAQVCQCGHDVQGLQNGLNELPLRD